MEKAVFKELGKDDETFSIVSTLLLYGGSRGGLHFSPVFLVRTSDVVEPRDVVVITKLIQSQGKLNYRVVHIETVADGMTVDFE